MLEDGAYGANYFALDLSSFLYKFLETDLADFSDLIVHR